MADLEAAVGLLVAPLKVAKQLMLPALRRYSARGEHINIISPSSSDGNIGMDAIDVDLHFKETQLPSMSNHKSTPNAYQFASSEGLLDSVWL